MIRLTLAKKLYKDHPTVYNNVEHARASVRLYFGNSTNSKRLKDREFFREKTYDSNPFKLPESRSTPREVFKLPTSVKKVLLLSDVHFPYQDNTALTTALLDGKKEKVDCIFINGDLLDFYSVSFHEKDPRKMNLKDEIETGKEFFKNLRASFPKTLIYYIPGNHEIRIERYLKVKAPELLDMDEFRIDMLLKLAEHRINFITHGTKVYFGKLMVEHGDKMRGTGGVNPARTLFLRLKRHAICGHFHRSSENTSKIYDGDPIVTFSTGCLCELEPGYLEVNEHNHGHAIIEMFPGGNFAVRNKKIINGKAY